MTAVMIIIRLAIMTLITDRTIRKHIAALIMADVSARMSQMRQEKYVIRMRCMYLEMGSALEL